ncbi:DMT family transporter [Marinicellulosiphila megalodicopiae]|uniref:DMT family transporter n=1 Tax=Marinicellulosiphila megalodicopiae TaxID=2724896 RepID=UPI003BB1C8C0
MSLQTLKLSFITLTALMAFAANSVFCRNALESNILGLNKIDPGSFTSIRLISGAIFLGCILFFKYSHFNIFSPHINKPKWRSSLFLFLYAITFSYGYVSQDTGTGALILFGSVQISMICVHIFNGKTLHYSEYIGILIAFLGLVYLVFPNLNSPSFIGVILMSASGLAWALYSINGMGAKHPIDDTAINFIRTIPIAILLLFINYQSIHITQAGLWLAIASGVIASGAGYAIWYAALKSLNVTQASVLQLSVPIIAALGGVIFTNEILTFRFLLASLFILGGILLVLFGKKIR